MICLLWILCIFSPVEGKKGGYLSVAAGSFDVYRPKYQSFEFDLEWKMPWDYPLNPYVSVRPLLGLMTTVKRSFYGCLGIDFEILLLRHIYFAPGFAAGYYAKGGGKDLGFPLEFRSGIELGWQFCDSKRLGLHFYHLSNASIGSRNPGEESLIFFLDIPISKRFPF